MTNIYGYTPATVAAYATPPKIDKLPVKPIVSLSSTMGLATQVKEN